MAFNSSDVHFYFLPVENHITSEQLIGWLGCHPHYPVLATVAYLLVIKYGPVFMSTRKAVNLKPLLFAWNSALAAFSIIASFRFISYYSYTRSKDHAMSRMLCANELDNVTAFWGFLFTISKIVEMGDTVFLLIRKRPVLFLHWYHHATVLLFTWFAVVADAPTGKVFTAMNVIVHSFMYTYYAVQTLGFKLPRLVSISITSLQILQMLGGIAVLLMSYNRLHDVDCRTLRVVLISGALMYGSYLLLFVDFFVKSYVRGSRKSKAD